VFGHLQHPDGVLLLVAPTFFDASGGEVACVVTEGTPLTEAEIHVVHHVLIELSFVQRLGFVASDDQPTWVLAVKWQAKVVGQRILDFDWVRALGEYRLTIVTGGTGNLEAHFLPFERDRELADKRAIEIA